eukprot:2372631-Prorocentrum_lima.AAC.1
MYIPASQATAVNGSRHRGRECPATCEKKETPFNVGGATARRCGGNSSTRRRVGDRKVKSVRVS